MVFKLISLYVLVCNVPVSCVCIHLLYYKILVILIQNYKLQYSYEYSITVPFFLFKEFGKRVIPIERKRRILLLLFNIFAIVFNKELQPSNRQLKKEYYLNTIILVLLDGINSLFVTITYSILSLSCGACMKYTTYQANSGRDSSNKFKEHVKNMYV